MDNIKVSVIIPVYKVPLDYLQACFDSLIAQSMQKCEFIVVSDGAPEAEKSICEEYATKDSRFKFFKKDHAGVSAARNYGIDQAQGEYIMFVDSDDWLGLNAIKAMYSLIQRESIDIGLANAIKKWQNGKKEKLLPIKNEEKKLKLTDIPTFTVWSYIFKTSIIRKEHIYFNTELRYSEDRAFIYHYCCFCKNISITSDVIYFYRQHQLSVCHNNQSIDQVFQQFLAANYIGKILTTKSNLSHHSICGIKNKIARMGMTIFFKYHNGMLANHHYLKNNFYNTIDSSIFNFYHCLIRSKIASIVELILKM